MTKRVLLFLAVNFLIIISVSFLMNAFNLTPYLTSSGLNLGSLAVFCLIWGFAGSFISLLISRWMAKRVYGVVLIDPNTTQQWERSLLVKVYGAAKKAGLTKMPEVGVYDSQEINAFATGPTKNRALVAVSSGLVDRLNDDQIEGVLGHEVAHIANGDMVTMTLMQGLVNSFVLFLSRAIAHVIVSSTKRDGERGSFVVYYVVSFVLEMALMVLGSLVVAFYSRIREYSADKDGAQLVGRHKMIAALEGLRENSQLRDPYLESKNASFKNMQISTPSNWFALFSSHPPLESRIKRLKSMS